jgi:hypothetical protein
MKRSEGGMHGNNSAGTTPRGGLPSAYTVGQYNQQWIVGEAEHRRKLALAREVQDADPGPVLRTRRKAGYLLIRAGMWLCAVSFPAPNRQASASQ